MMTVMLRAECELHVSGVDSPRLTWIKGVKPGLRDIKRVCFCSTREEVMISVAHAHMFVCCVYVWTDFSEIIMPPRRGH